MGVETLSKIQRQLGQLLVDERLLSKDVLEEQLAFAADRGQHLAKVLVDNGQVREEDILRAVSSRVGIKFLDMAPAPAVDMDLLRKLDYETATSLCALPVERDGSGKVVVVLHDPFNAAKISVLGRAFNAEVAVRLGPKKRIEAAIAASYAELATLPEADSDDDMVEKAKISQALADLTAKDRERPHINDLLNILIEMDGSDLHLTAGAPPKVRLNGSLVPLDQFGMQMPAELREMIYDILTSRQREQLEEKRELDCSHPVPGKGRFRANVFFQRDSIGCVMRAIPNDVLPLEDLNMPPAVTELAKLSRGMVLVTGPTGSGKSTTLASVVDLVNRTRADHIMTVEDPIEFIHRHKKSIVNQREVGSDTMSFANALKSALRQDPDVILVGEMRDLETMETAITAAETGHLVLGTLHTQDAPKSIERMVDAFPSDQQQQVRVQLSSSIQGVLSQQLLPTKDGKGRVVAVELMIATSAIRNLIREGKVHQIASAMQAGKKFGMQTMDASLAHLVSTNQVAYEVAAERASDPAGFEALMKEYTR